MKYWCKIIGIYVLTILITFPVFSVVKNYGGITLIFSVLGMYYLLAPIGVYFFFRNPPILNLEVFDPHLEQLSKYPRAFFERACQSLEESGFKTVASLKKEMPNGTLFLMLFHNREQADIAAAYSLGTSKRNTYVEYCTKFENGFDICTNNSRIPLGTIAPEPYRSAYQYPSIEVVNLYRVHQEILKKYGPSSPKIIPPEEKAVQDLFDGLRKAHEYQVTAGYMKYDARSDTDSPTIKGAVLMTWKMCFPVRQIRSHIYKSRFHKILKHLRLEHYLK